MSTAPMVVSDMCCLRGVVGCLGDYQLSLGAGFYFNCCYFNCWSNTYMFVGVSVYILVHVIRLGSLTDSNMFN